MQKISEKKKKKTRIQQRRNASFVFFEKLHKRFLMYQACVQSVLEDAQIPQAQLSETLINEVYRRMDVERNWGLHSQLPLI